MKKPLIVLMLMGATASAEVHYFGVSPARVPDGVVCAVEVRASAGKRGGSWSVAWPGVEIDFAAGVGAFVDGVDRNSGELTVNGHRFALRDIIDPGSANSLAVEWGSDSLAQLLVGHKELHRVGAMALPRPRAEVAVESKMKSFELIDLIIETDSNAFSRLESGLTPDEIERGRRWSYLDRDGDAQAAVIGGQYELRQVGTELIYVGGAKTNPASWKPGMVKGRLMPTAYEGYFRLQWFDATGRELSGENYAEIDFDLGILKLTFQQLETSVRFHD